MPHKPIPDKAWIKHKPSAYANALGTSWLGQIRNIWHMPGNDKDLKQQGSKHYHRG